MSESDSAIRRAGKTLDALVDMTTEDLPTLEEAEESLRGAGYDPRELSRRLLERLMRAGLLT